MSVHGRGEGTTVCRLVGNARPSVLLRATELTS